MKNINIKRRSLVLILAMNASVMGASSGGGVSVPVAEDSRVPEEGKGFLGGIQEWFSGWFGSAKDVTIKAGVRVRKAGGGYVESGLDRVKGVGCGISLSTMCLGMAVSGVLALYREKWGYIAGWIVMGFKLTCWSYGYLEGKGFAWYTKIPCCLMVVVALYKLAEILWNFYIQKVVEWVERETSYFGEEQSGLFDLFMRHKRKCIGLQVAVSMAGSWWFYKED